MSIRLSIAVVNKSFPELACVGMSQETAETLGLQCLSWLAGNEDLLPVFRSSTGASGSDLRDRALDPEFLGSVLDFVMMDDAWVIAFCDTLSLPYDRLVQARAALPGGATINWT